MDKKPLLALSGTQPWFWACMNAGKHIENRSWPTKVRGTVAFHAAKGMTLDQYQEAKGFILSVNKNIVVPYRNELVRGAIIGLVDIVDCVSAHASPWFFGEYGFVLRNPRPLEEPIFCKGALGFWPVPSEIVIQIEEQLCTVAK